MRRIVIFALSLSMLAFGSASKTFAYKTGAPGGMFPNDNGCIDGTTPRPQVLKLHAENRQWPIGKTTRVSMPFI